MGQLNFGLLKSTQPDFVDSFNSGREQARQNKLQELSMQKADMEMADDAATRQAYKDAAGDQNKLLSILQGNGQYRAADAVKKQQLEAQAKQATIGKDNSVANKNNADLATKKIDFMSSTTAALMQNPSFENYQGLMQRGVAAGLLSPEEAQQHMATMPRDPQQIRAKAAEANHMLMSAKERMTFDQPQPKEISLGNRVAFIDMNPNSKTYKQEVSSSNVGMTPGESARIGLEQQRIGQAERHFNVNQANKANPPQGKPMPASALKMQQEELDAIGTASSINADMSGVENLIKSGKLDLGLVSNAAGSARNYLGVSNENSKNLASFKATLEKMRNDSLRLNKGVQTDGDAQRAWNELLSNINDAGVVKQRLGEIKKINERALNIRKMNVDNIRRNYNAPDIDTSGYENQKPAIGGGGSNVDDLLKKYGG